MKDPIENLLKQPAKSSLCLKKQQTSIEMVENITSSPMETDDTSFLFQNVNNDQLLNSNSNIQTPEKSPTPQKQNKKVKFSESNLETCFYFEDSPMSVVYDSNYSSSNDNTIIFDADPMQDEILNLIERSS